MAQRTKRGTTSRTSPRSRSLAPYKMQRCSGGELRAPNVRKAPRRPRRMERPAPADRCRCRRPRLGPRRRRAPPGRRCEAPACLVGRVIARSSATGDHVAERGPVRDQAARGSPVLGRAATPDHERRQRRPKAPLKRSPEREARGAVASNGSLGRRGAQRGPHPSASRSDRRPGEPCREDKYENHADSGLARRVRGAAFVGRRPSRRGPTKAAEPCTRRDKPGQA